MALHLLKLCVGCDSIADLESWIAATFPVDASFGRAREQIHTTRMVPARRDELVAGGSLYWVIRGQVACRQPLLGIRPFTDDEGVGRCRLVLEPTVIPVEPRPCRPFQGWRYLRGADAPPDLRSDSGAAGLMPDHLRRELRLLGLL